MKYGSNYDSIILDKKENSIREAAYSNSSKLFVCFSGLVKPAIHFPVLIGDRWRTCPPCHQPISDQAMVAQPCSLRVVWAHPAQRLGGPRSVEQRPPRSAIVLSTARDRNVSGVMPFPAPALRGRSGVEPRRMDGQ